MSLNYTHSKKNDKLDCTEVFFLSQINKDQEILVILYGYEYG